MIIHQTAWHQSIQKKVKQRLQLQVKDLFQFDTVYFDGGVSSKLVEDAGLVRRYLWDFGNDGQIDTVIRKRTRLGVP